MKTETLETLETRLALLERDMMQVKTHLNVQKERRTNPWLDEVYGAFKDDPLFEEAIHFGRKWREEQNAVDFEDDHVPDGYGYDDAPGAGQSRG